MKDFWQFYAYQRYFGTSQQRFLYVALFVLCTTAWVLAVVAWSFTPVTPVNLICSMFWGWVAWPTLIGQAGNGKKAKDDATSNS